MVKILYNSNQSEFYANSVETTNGVYVVSVFSSLCAPYWDMYAIGSIMGLTRGSNREHLVRATLESIEYKTKDILEDMHEN